VTRQDDVQVQLDLIAVLVASAPKAWKRIFIDHEIQDLEREFNTSTVGFAVTKHFMVKPRTVDFFLDESHRKLVDEVGRRLMARVGVSKITLDIIVQADRRFRIFPQYGLTTRLDGDIAATTRHLLYSGEDPLLATESALTRRA